MAHNVAFTSYRDGNGEIYEMYASGSNEMRLTNNHPEQDETLTDSPDGNYIVFTSLQNGNRGIYKMWYDGSA
jgi:Tol biopolymer transport system component